MMENMETPANIRDTPLSGIPGGNGHVLAANPESRTREASCFVLEVPEPLAYQAAWDLQRRIVAAKAGGALGADVILMLEHPAVFTLGKRGGRENLKVNEAFLEQAGIPIIHVERGGDITYHGPGQLVVYPIVDLKRAGWGVLDFVQALEDIMIRVAAQWGIEAQRNSLNRGVWVGMKKLASIGIAIRRNVSFHGIALNVNLSLDPFSWINPCGLSGISMTSMQEHSDTALTMDQVRASVKRHIREVLGQDLTPESLPGLMDRL